MQFRDGIVEAIGHTPLIKRKAEHDAAAASAASADAIAAKSAA